MSSLEVPTWIAAIATAAAAGGVVVAVGLVRKMLNAHAKQSAAQHELTAELIKALDLQSQNLRLALDERRRAQACQVFIELTRPDERLAQPAKPPQPKVSGHANNRVAATVHNNSQQPVYDLYIIWLLGTTRMGKPDPAARLLPGQQICFERAPESVPQTEAGDAAPNASSRDADALTAFLTFRDAAGVRWTVREDGTLSDISPAHD